MNKILFLLPIALLFACSVSKKQETSPAMTPVQSPTDIYGFKVVSLDGGSIDFSSFKGKKILIVNTASKCGYTPQYKELQELYEKNRNKLVIVGFPTNDFGEQEPGDNAEIMEFCTKKLWSHFPDGRKNISKG